MNENIINYQNELSILEGWFRYYDTQAIQYQRDIRVKNSSSIDINSLDQEAYAKAERIKELRHLIEQEFNNIN